MGKQKEGGNAEDQHESAAAAHTAALLPAGRMASVNGLGYYLIPAYMKD
jgi:hypothetical protein